ncbi:MAG: metallophosphoesterase [Ruminococcaceae bacterium]|nr:metallophosphoesterase [Oscillospiraceae bacterium]
MKWLIISDTHGYYAELSVILETEKEIKDVIFLGDGLSDIDRAKMEYPDRNFICVKGNCDLFSKAPSMDILTLDGYKVLITHGDGFDVKTSKLAIRRAAIGMGADIVLYGHTHRQYYEYLEGLYIFCPGSVKPEAATNYIPSYGILDTSDGYPDIYNCEII